MNIFKIISKDIAKICLELFDVDLSNFIVEYPKDKSHGDVSTNVAMILKSKLNQAPVEIAKKLLPKISDLEYVENAEVVAPGFINLNMKAKFWNEMLKFALMENWGSIDIGGLKKVDVEFVSANPTGPMHIGHSRGAIYGDVLCNLLENAQFLVTREYYTNDAGSQIDTLGKSLYLRYRELIGDKIEIPASCYPGEYLIDVAKEMLDEYGDGVKENDPKVKSFAIQAMMKLIKSDLANLGVKHDVFISEKDDVQPKIQETFEILKKKNLIYRGILNPPKGKVVEDWEPREQDLFKSTDFGDDVDRPLIKSDGTYTYFAPDIAYHYNKISRGFDELVLLLGADHSGYIKRIKAAVSAMSDGRVPLDVKINQLVNLMKNGEPFKMSKRAGNFVTVDDLVKEIGIDVLRFVMLSRSSDTIIDLDVEKVKEETKENQVFYVQYAYARMSSVLRKAVITSDEMAILDDESEINLIKQILIFPKSLEVATIAHEPHRVVYYMNDLATAIHHLWSRGVENPKMRLIVEDDVALTNARLNLLNAAKNTMNKGFALLGIKPLEKM